MFGICSNLFSKVQENAYSIFLDQGAVIEEPIPGQDPKPMQPPTNGNEADNVSTEKKIIVIDAVTTAEAEKNE